MHRFLPCLALIAACAASASPAAPGCPRNNAPVTERFISADCPDCWAAAQGADTPAGWLFDWITPAAQGPDAELAAAAPLEARERAERAGAAPPPGGEKRVSPGSGERQASPQRRTRLPGPKLQVQSGPAWNGYFGLQLDVRGTLPAGSSGWLALVEMLPAGSEGSRIERQLVRSVAGPLPLDGAGSPRGLRHLRALRWPESAQPTRLQARGWIEGPDGRLLAVAADRCAAH
ncbi:hypothetical protein [Aquabacterium sp.]|uniref:hypothetical protein n=1 Tax=Aquabacterium sp. TaxID=1872578 RepID=UPI002CF7F6E1|nr:hypothetical protein [Aquabacterium sp.]HSW04131.1 hypothetical protein [Aquabacterium sp.]